MSIFFNQVNLCRRPLPKFLKNYKSKKYQIVTQFKNIPTEYKDIEWKVSNIYASLLKNNEKYLL
ncbi:MAG: hypothetical protein MJ092_08230, partial [Lachnospiraceae bacterium]|nr:hypothetical protein [Lachnospiraceae bacterium]